MNLIAIAALVVSVPLTQAVSAPPERNPKELGRVHWGRDLDNALAESKNNGKPVLLLFQEIPGCDGCVAFGAEPLSHPLLVEAIETQFVPIVIRNNVAGEEAKNLKRFNEPAQNYPVMRILNADARDIVERQESIFTTHDVSKRLIEALATAGRDVPEYLKIAMLESDTSRDHHERLTFAMSCYWEGEAGLGAIDGVIATRAVSYEGQEAVDVVFDPTIVSIEELAAAADKAQCAAHVFAHGDVQLVHARNVLGERVQAAKSVAKVASADDQLYSLAHSPLRFVPMTPMQAMKVNSAIGLNHDDEVNQFLSPEQIALAKQINATLAKNPKALDGLKPSTAIEGMADYTEALRKRLKQLNQCLRATWRPHYHGAMNLDLDLSRLFAYEFWADREALHALRDAGDKAPPRALAIMNHILAAAHLWLTRLSGEKVKVDVWPQLSIAEMDARIDWLRDAWQRWIAGAKSAQLDQKIAYVNSLGESWSSSARDILTHIPIHAAYHRGQIAMLLGQSKQKAAYTDFIHASRQGLI